VRVVGGFSRRRKARTKKIKVEDKLMDLWHKMIFPVRRVWLSVSARVKARKNGPSLLSFSSAYIFPRKSAAFFLVCSLFLIYFLFILFNLYILQKLFFKKCLEINNQEACLVLVVFIFHSILIFNA
jgi:hypothetical protein